MSDTRWLESLQRPELGRRVPSQLEREGVSLVGNLLAPFLATVAAVSDASSCAGRPMPLSAAEVNLMEALIAEGIPPEQQVAMGPYWADFLYPRAWLCVEVDGKHHVQRRDRDALRDAFFLESGFDVLRITGAAVWTDPYDCADVVREYVEQGLRLQPGDFPRALYRYHGKRGPRGASAHGGWR